MSGGAAVRFALSLLPDLVEWIVGRFEAGESPEVIRRDIKDRRAEVEALRAKRDLEFTARFGPLTEGD